MEEGSVPESPGARDGACMQLVKCGERRGASDGDPVQNHPEPGGSAQPARGFASTASRPFRSRRHRGRYSLPKLRSSHISLLTSNRLDTSKFLKFRERGEPIPNERSELNMELSAAVFAVPSFGVYLCVPELPISLQLRATHVQRASNSFDSPGGALQFGLPLDEGVGQRRNGSCCPSFENCLRAERQIRSGVENAACLRRNNGEFPNVENNESKAIITLLPARSVPPSYGSFHPLI